MRGGKFWCFITFVNLLRLIVKAEDNIDTFVDCAACQTVQINNGLEM